MDGELVGAIYEAGALPHLWPETLSRISRAVGSVGGLIFSPWAGATGYVASPSLDGIMRDYVAGGWMTRTPSRIPEAVLHRPHPGFFTDLDCRTLEEMARMPVYTDFLRPRGAEAAAGTIVRTSDGGRIAITLEGFSSHAAARAGIAALDPLRPHIARAVTLSARVEMDRLHMAVRTLAAIGLPAAVLGAEGRLLAANAAFDAMVDTFGSDGARRFRLKRPGANDLLSGALDRCRAGLGGRTIPIATVDAASPMALHLVPIEGGARDLFASGATLAIIGRTERGVEDGVFLETLFDLTAAEARLARGLLAGGSLPEIARATAVSQETLRTQLKALFAKTGTKRQVDLIRLFDRLAPPGGAA